VLLGRLRIRGKLILLVVIPLLAVVALTVPVVVGRVQQAGRAGDTAAAVKVAAKVGPLIQELQKERLLSIGYLLQVADKAQLTQQTSKVDGQIAALRSDKSLNLPAPVSDAVSSMQDVTQLRAAVLSGSARPDQVMGGYNAVATRLINALRLEQGADAKTSEGRQVVALDAALRLDEQISYCGTYLLIIDASKDPQTLIPYYSALSTLQLWADRISTFATRQQINLYYQVQGELTRKLGSAFSDPTKTNPITALAAVPLPTLFPGVQSVVGVGQVIEKTIISDVTTKVDSSRTSALTTAYVVGGLSVLVLLVVLLLSAAVARAVVRPLTRLTTSADRVARVAEAELVRVADDESDAPAPIQLDAVDVSAGDEIGDLARAFQRVQGTAAGLVERQVAIRRNVAQMFGHVGRRTQNLVARQVALIDRLEREEADPDRLQHLYRLDHVSSRLRRNAGSLVVLSGATGVDQQTTPLALVDVVRLALGEIEDYTRVDVRIPEDIAVVPAAINDLVLMLAELMENATGFSPPHVRVTVTAQPMPYGVLLAIVDRGLGLSEQRIAQENARLERRERLDLAPTEVLGLFVVGRLARRHEIGVALSPTPGGGLTATVQLGQHLLTSAPLPGGGPARALPTRPVSAAPVSSAPISPAPVPQPLLPPPIAVPPATYFDAAAVNRATHSIASSQPWSAFIPRQRTSAEDEPAPSIGNEPTEAHGMPALRQRVPGANLPAGVTPPVAAAPPPQLADAAAARALVEDFESGVRRALDSGNSAFGAMPANAPSSPGAPPLTRRKPGVTLQALQGSLPGNGRSSGPPPSPAGPSPAFGAPSDPHEARDLVEQFEAGVTRALREARTDHPHGEGSTR
jgi:signal transduction histidine kinase